MLRVQAESSPLGANCRYCGKRGPDLTAESLRCLLQHEELHALKIGVSRKTSTRFKQHTVRGWEVLHTWDLANGVDAYKTEAVILT